MLTAWLGKLVSIEFDDELKQINIGAKIVDDDAWQKCAQGVYTGFSIGGTYVKAWEEGEFVRFTANPSEVSVVDNPCVADAAETGIDPPSPGDGTTAITLQLGSPLPYARIQEYGGVAGRATFKKPNGRRPFLPPRPYLQPALDEMQAALPDIVQEAVEKAVGS
jgi:hypothetical protein